MDDLKKLQAKAYINSQKELLEEILDCAEELQSGLSKVNKPIFLHEDRLSIASIKEFHDFLKFLNQESLQLNYEDVNKNDLFFIKYTNSAFPKATFFSDYSKDGVIDFDKYLLDFNSGFNYTIQEIKRSFKNDEKVKSELIEDLKDSHLIINSVYEQFISFYNQIKTDNKEEAKKVFTNITDEGRIETFLGIRELESQVQHFQTLNKEKLNPILDNLKKIIGSIPEEKLVLKGNAYFDSFYDFNRELYLNALLK